MPSAERAVQTSLEVLRTGGLSGSAAFIAEGHMTTALLVAMVASACVLILTAATLLSELATVEVRRIIKKREQQNQLTPKDEEKPKA
jgi:hypothetical protein